MSNVCKKCGRQLPDEYKHKICENCMNQRVQSIKNGAKAAAGVAGSVACVGVALITKGQADLRKK